MELKSDMIKRLIENVIEDELRWIDKCEKNKINIPYDAFKASLRRIQENVRR